MRDPFLAYLHRPTRRRLARVVEMYHGTVWRAAMRVTRNAEDAADVCQDVFLQLLLEPPAAASVGSAEAYLAWRVLGRVANLRRSERRRREREVAWERPTSGDGLPLEDAVALEEALNTLPADLREPLALRYLAGRTNEAIAESLGIAVRTVEHRLERARDLLRRRLTPVFLGAGLAGITVEVEGRDLAPAPASLLPGLLAVVRLGGALARVKSGTAFVVGGTLMTQKTVTIAAAILLLLSAPVAVAVWRRSVEPPVVAVGNAPAVKSAVAEGPAPPATEPTLAVAAPVTPPEPPRASLRGNVCDAGDAPLPSALVRFRQEIDGEQAADLTARGYHGVTVGVVELETVSDEAGEYRFESLLPLEGRVSALQKGLLLAWPLPDLEAPLKAGNETRRHLRLVPARRVHGQVTTAEGEPIEGASVIFCKDATAHAASEVFVTDTLGRFDTEPTVAMDRQAMLCLPLEVRFLAPSLAAEIRRLGFEDFTSHTAEVVTALGPEMPVTLWIAEPNGRPVAGAIIKTGGRLALEAVSAANGRAVLSHLQPKRTSLSITKDGYFDLALIVEPGASEDVRVTLQPHGPGVRVRMVFDAAIPVDDRKVTDAYFECRDAATKKLRGLYRPHCKRDNSTNEHHFWPEPGEYSLRIELGLISVATPVFNYTGSALVDLEIPIRLEPPWIRGRLVHAGSGKPAKDVSIAVRFVEKGRDYRSSWERNVIVNDFFIPDRPGNAKVVRTDNDGNFLLLLPRASGGRRQFWSPKSNVAALLAGSAETGWSDDAVFEFNDRTQIEDLRLELIPTGAIAGRVIDEAGNPAASELVAASDLQGSTRWTKTDRDGRFRIDQLRAGRHCVLPLGRCLSASIGSGGRGSDDVPGFPAPCDFVDRPVTIASAETTPLDIDLARDRLPVIDGTIAPELLGTGHAAQLSVEFAMVVDGVVRTFSSMLNGNRPVDQGRFRIENILPGEYRLQLHTSGRPIAEATVTASKGRVTTINLGPPLGVLRVPVSGVAPGEVQVPRILHPGPGEELDTSFQEWSGWKLVPETGAVRVEGLPLGRVQVLLVAPGVRAVWTETVSLTAGINAIAPAVIFERGRIIIVRLEPPPGHSAPLAAELDVEGEAADAWTVPHHSRRRDGEPVWELSGFAPGSYRVSARAAFFVAAEATVEVSDTQDAEVVVPLATESP